MSKKYTAILRMENGGHIHRVDYDYTSKKNYARDCRANGYRVTAILTDAEIKHIQEAGWRSGLKYSNLVIDLCCSAYKGGRRYDNGIDWK